MSPPNDKAAGGQGGVILERGQTIDRFVVLGLVGRGGMGEVYAAYDPELDRKIAIKLLRARGDAADGKTRLLREAQAIAKLQHPNVVVVYDVGTFGESVFIAMEFVEGRTVGGWLSAGQRTRREILDVYLGAGRGLAAAHAAGLVHRDFKPDNVMVTNDGQVRVMDFGLARPVGEAPEASLPSPAGVTGSDVADTFDPALDPDATMDLRRGSLSETGPASGKYLSLKLTQTGAMLGTPAYMAPEQFAIKATDARTDQFSFCVALYETLYGARPFAGETFLALMTSVTTGSVSPPPAKARVPGWMRKVLLRGLSTDPEGRYASMTTLLVALETDPTVRARRLAAGGAVLACLALGVVAARRGGGRETAMCRGGGEHFAGIWEAGGARSTRKDAISTAFAKTGKPYAAQAFASVSRALDDYAAKWIRADVDACEATRVRGELSDEVLDLRTECLQERLTSVRALTDLFANADAQVVENAVGAVSALPALDRCSDVPTLKAVVKPPADPATLARVKTVRGDLARFVALRDAGHCTDAQGMELGLVGAARATGYQPLLGETLFETAMLGDACGDQSRMFEHFRESFDVAVRARDDEVAASAAILLGSTLSDRARELALGRDWLSVGRALLARIGDRPRLEAWALNSDATIHIAEGKGDAAVDAFRKAYELKLRVLGKDNYDTLTGLTNMGVGLQYAGRCAEAVVADTEGREAASRILGPEHPLLALASSNEGECLNTLHRYAEARIDFQRAADVWRRAGSDIFFRSYALTGLGLALLGEGKPAEAVAPLDEALRARVERQLDPERVGETRFALARALWSRPAERERALGLARQALADYALVKTPTVPAPDVAAWLRAPSVGAPPNLVLAARTAGPSESPDR
jgi:eukaryotic-like serine/threonine-protein kinase